MSEGLLQKLLWVQEFQVVHPAQVDHPDLADLVVQENRCRLCLLLFQTL